jgi:hypothetical protein
MRCHLLLVAGLLLVCGCHERHHAAAVTVVQAERAERANLALGPSADTSRLAALYASRSDWPSVETGYRVDDVTFYESMTYDVQMHFDRNNSLYDQAQNVRTGMWVH